MKQTISVWSRATEPNLDPREVDYAKWELAYNGFMEPAYRSALANLRLPDDRPSVGLDVGCGPGGHFPLLDEVTGGRATVLGLDVSDPHRKVAEEVIRRPGLEERVRVEWADLSQPLPQPDAVFDWALAADALWPALFERPEAVVAELARVVRPGGIVCLWFYHLRSTIVVGHTDLDHYLDLALERGFAPLSPSVHHEHAPAWLRGAGLNDVNLSWHSVAGRSPLNAAETGYLGDWWLPERRRLSREDLAQLGMTDEAWSRWRDLSDRASPAYVLHGADYRYLQLGMLTWGRVPAL